MTLLRLRRPLQKFSRARACLDQRPVIDQFNASTVERFNDSLFTFQRFLCIPIVARERQLSLSTRIQLGEQGLVNG
jgi:hypothetical protein